MDIWIIRDGEKIGPIHDFEVRQKIEAGELPSNTPAWHEGLGAWRPLGEIDLFSREFESPITAVPVAEPDLPRESPKPPPLPPQTFYVRRFWARWLDLYLYSGLWWLGMWAVGQDIEATIRNPWVLFVRYVPWFVIEILLLQHLGTTPGKWLLGIRVTNKDGSRMNLTESMHRALRVMFAGVGFGWELLSVFCQALSVFTAKNLGNTLWDHAGGHQVVVTPLKPLRVVSLICLFAFAFVLQILVVSRYTHKIWISEVPAMKTLMPENPLWQLPERTRKP
jgi:uncharacterized RDD family membrane protein YckC